MEAQGSSPPRTRTTNDSSIDIGADFGHDGWTLFAGIVLAFIGLWDVFEGLLALIRSSYFAGHPIYGDLWIWALAWLAFGVLEGAAGAAIIGGRAWGRWFGIVVAALSALVSMLTISIYPFWSLVALAAQFAVLYGLTVRWAPRQKY